MKEYCGLYDAATACESDGFKPRKRRLALIGTLLCMGVIMLAMVLTSPSKKKRKNLL